MQINNQNPLIVEVKEPEDAMMMVMLTSINSVKVDNGMVQLTVQEFVVDEDVPQLVYKKIRFDELRQALELLNG